MNVSQLGSPPVEVPADSVNTGLSTSTKKLLGNVSEKGCPSVVAWAAIVPVAAGASFAPLMVTLNTAVSVKPPSVSV